MEGIETDAANHDTSRNRRLIKENCGSDSDGEGVSGFYVREKKDCAPISPETLIVNSIDDEDCCDTYANKIGEKKNDLSSQLPIDSVKVNTPNLENTASNDSKEQSNFANENVDHKRIIVTSAETTDEIIKKDDIDCQQDQNHQNVSEQNNKAATILKNALQEEKEINGSNKQICEMESIEKSDEGSAESNGNDSAPSTLNSDKKEIVNSLDKDKTNDEDKGKEDLLDTEQLESENSADDTSNKISVCDKKSTVFEAAEEILNVQGKDDGSQESNSQPKEDTVEAENAEIEIRDCRNERDKVSFLKEQLLQPKLSEQNKLIENNDNEDMEDMEDFDPSLLCPDISMDIDESPVITSNSENGSQNDGSSSPLPYEPTFSTYVDEMTGAEVTFDLTSEECELRSKLFGPGNPVQYSKIHCTACNVHLGSALDAQKNRFVHPLLKVLICRNCYHFYTSGEFEKDEDGSELYCRWCGQGGQVLCCSTCEFVFCKKCIKNNFGLKKFKEIRDSDDWRCFRCAPSQLSILRASCAEFMDYVRTEISRAATLIKDVPSFMTTDHTTCCTQQKKKEDSTPKEPKKRKRKGSCEDPDYNPLKDLGEPPEKQKIVTSGTTVVPKPIVITPPPGLTPIRPPQQSFRVGNTMFRPRPATYTMARAPGPSGQGTIRVSGPGYIKILPQKPMATMATKPNPAAFRQPLSKPIIVQSPKGLQPNQPLKHEWFEKTVRAAARVNSNLSYTLTQLNRQQANATTVESLAVVHNKLQEVLSTSINSLIQIRKNLRSEFISGIKCIKFPPKQQVVPAAKPQIIHTVKDDDDVIFVSNAAPTVTPIGVSTPIPKIVLPPSVTIKPAKKPNDLYSNPSPSTSFSTPKTSTNGDTTRLGGYIKVKSFSALQNVPSECITIPDDPPSTSPSPSEKNNTVSENANEIRENETLQNHHKKKNKDGDVNDTSEIICDDDIPIINVNLKEMENDPEIKNMMKVAVILKKIPDMERLIEEKCKSEINEENVKD